MTDLATFEAAIAAHVSHTDKIRHQLAVAEAELRGMIKMRDLLTQGQNVSVSQQAKLTFAQTVKQAAEKQSNDGGYRGGRQPGAISREWRLILSDLYWKSGAGAVQFGTSEIISVAKAYGITLRPSEAQSRMQHYQQFGYTQIAEDGVVVTDSAAIKFGFDKEPLKNEAPNADAMGPQ